MSFSEKERTKFISVLTSDGIVCWRDNARSTATGRFVIELLVQTRYWSSFELNFVVNFFPNEEKGSNRLVKNNHQYYITATSAYSKCPQFKLSTDG